MKPTVSKGRLARPDSTASPLAKQLGKRHAFDLIEEELFVSMARTFDLISRDFVELFHSFGLSEPLYNALRIVGGESQVSQHGLSVGTIASRMVCRNPDTTRLVDRLEKLGLVQCVTCTQDGRRRLVKITQSGNDLLKALHRPVRAIHRKQFAGLDSKSQQKLLELVEQLRSSLED